MWLVPVINLGSFAEATAVGGLIVFFTCLLDRSLLSVEDFFFFFLPFVLDLGRSHSFVNARLARVASTFVRDVTETTLPAFVAVVADRLAGQTLAVHTDTLHLDKVVVLIVNRCSHHLPNVLHSFYRHLSLLDFGF